MIERSHIRSMSVTLEVEEAVLLYVFLDRGGRVERMGSGERQPLHTERNLYSGTTDAKYFETMLDYLTDEMLASPGSYDVPDIAGERCRLRVLFELEGERSSGLEFEYGSESEGPPSEVHDMVHAILDLTEAWYAGQQQHP